MSEHDVDVDEENIRLRGLNSALAEAIKPFVEFAMNVDENGWTSQIHRESISTWFGPSDFARARSAYHKAMGGGNE